MNHRDELPGKPAVALGQSPGQTTAARIRCLGRTPKEDERKTKRFRLIRPYTIAHNARRLQRFFERVAKHPDAVRFMRRARLKRRLRNLPAALPGGHQR